MIWVIEMSMKNKISKYIQFIVFRFIILLLQLMPLWFRIKVSENILVLVAAMIKKRKKLIKSNIQFAFPDKSEEWVNDIADKNIKNMGRFVAEYIDLPKLIHQNLNLKISFFPSKEKTIEDSQNGCIAILGHMGNWEWHGALFSSWMPGRIYALAKRQSNPWSNVFFEKLRRAGGVLSVFTDKGFFQYIRLIKNKNVLCFLADQDAGGNGRFINFLNRPASTFQGPAVIARMTGCDAFFAYSYHEKEKLNTRFEKLQKPLADPVKDPDEWDRQFTQSWVSMLEKAIIEHPSDYFWAHNRWKTQPSKSTDKISI